jgi:hypothetical protein
MIILKIPSYMVCSQIWLNLLDDDCYFWLHHKKWN